MVLHAQLFVANLGKGRMHRHIMVALGACHVLSRAFNHITTSQALQRGHRSRSCFVSFFCQPPPEPLSANPDVARLLSLAAAYENRREFHEARHTYEEALTLEENEHALLALSRLVLNWLGGPDPRTLKPEQRRLKEVEGLLYMDRAVNIQPRSSADSNAEQQQHRQSRFHSSSVFAAEEFPAHSAQKHMDIVVHTAGAHPFGVDAFMRGVQRETADQLGQKQPETPLQSMHR